MRSLLLFSLLSLTFAAPDADNLNPTGAGCVDPEGYLECYDTQYKQLTTCAEVANSTCSDTNAHLQTCMAGCDGAYLAGKVGCWLQGCWNRVYSCEYQQTAAEYVVGVDLVQSTVDIPFYPPPDGELPGGCTCNVGNAVGNFTDDAPYHCMPSAESGNREVFAECTCCQSAIPISNALNACPNTDLSFIGFGDRLRSVQNTMGERTPDQCAVLDSGKDSADYCAATYGVNELAGPVIYNPLKLPDGKPGTESLSNYPGTAFTTFTSVLTLTLDPGYKSTITPAPYNKENAEETSSGGSKTDADEAANTSGTGTVSGTGTAPSSTPTGLGFKVQAGGLGMWIGVVVGIAATLRL